MHPISYNGHVGMGSKGSNVVKFYGLKFDSINDAIKILRYIRPSDYTGLYFGRLRKIVGLVRNSDGRVLVMTYPSLKKRVLSSLERAEYFFGKSSI